METINKKEIKQENKKLAKKALSLDSKLVKLLHKVDKLKENGKTEEAKELQKKAASLRKEIKKLEAQVEANILILHPESKSADKSGSILRVENFNAYYGQKQSLFDINIEFPKNKVIAIIGPSGCGKSTFLKSLNRINDEVPVFRGEGRIIFDEEFDVVKLKNIHDPSEKIDISELRTRIGMVFQQPNPFPMSIYKNVIYGPKINGVKNKAELNSIAIESLKKAALYDEVKNSMTAIGTSLSGGQQQRLCIARAIANKPDILLMDEPTSALDPIAAAKVEELILELKKDYTIIMVTHSMQQAARISDYTAFFYEGELIEYDKTTKIFNNPKEQKTSDYIRGRFG